MKAGRLSERVEFDRPVDVPDGAGGRDRTWARVLTARAHFRYLRGGEPVQAARLEGRQPVVATIRRSKKAETIRAHWRMRDARTGEVYEIVAPPVPTEDRAFIEVTCETRGEQAAPPGNTAPTLQPATVTLDLTGGE